MKMKSFVHFFTEQATRKYANRGIIFKGNDGCCFAGAGHLIELKQQFPVLELIGKDNI